MKKLFVALFALTLITAAIGQPAVTRKAAELLEKARTMHGGTALVDLKTYQDATELIYFDNKGQVAAKLLGLIKVDFTAERVRLELSQNNKLVEIQQYDPKGSSTWTRQSGTLKLPKSQAETVRGLLYQGVTALRYGKNRDNATADGPGKMLDLNGEIVSLTTKGVKTSYLIDANGMVISERIITPQLGSTVTTYSDVREVNGIKLPYAGKTFLERGKNILFSEGKTSEIKINPIFTGSDFEMPKK